MENKELNQKKNYINVVKVFKSNGIERKFESGQILSSLEYVPEEVFIIKEGNARLISKINGKLTSISKLGKGDFIGIASILNGLSIEETRASNELVVYSLKVQEFIKLYQEKVDIKNYCDNNIWISEILYILKNFPKLFKKNLLTSTNLLDQFYEQSKLIPPELNVLNNLLKSEQILFSSYFSENLEIWSEIKTYSQLKQLFEKQRQFPIRIISIPKEIESLKINDSNKSQKEEEKKFDEKDQPSKNFVPLKNNPYQIKKIFKTQSQFPIRIISVPKKIESIKINDSNKSKKEEDKKSDVKDQTSQNFVPLKNNLNQINNEKKNIISDKEKIENTLGCFEIIARLMDFPLKRESVKNSLKQYFINNKLLSLKVCGKIAAFHGLKINIIYINSEIINRIRTPALIKFEENFAVISRSTLEGLEIKIPTQKVKFINYKDLKKFFPNGIQILHLEKTNLTQKHVFGLNWIYQFFKEYKGVFAQIFIAGFVIQLLTLANPLLIQVIIDKVISQRSLDTLQVLGFALLFVTLFEGILSSLKSFLLSDTSNRIDKKLSSEIIDHLLGLPLNYFQRRRTGELSSRISELEKIRNFLTSQALTTILDGAFSIIYILVMVLYSLKLTLISLIVLPIQILITFICGPLIKKQFRSVAETNAKSQSHLLEILNGIETVKTQNYEIKSKLKWQKLYERFINKNFEKNITGTLFIQASQILQKISQLLILWFGAGMVLQGYISLGQLIAFRIIAGYVTNPLLRLSNIWQGIQELKISFERLEDIINTKKEINALEKSKILMPKINGLIDFENINFEFSNKQNFLLSGINLSVKPNNFVAIVGQSGSGKSTLMKLIYRLYSPNEGKIIIDGFDISKVELSSLRNQIGFVPQEPLLFNGTIRENIAYKDEASENEIIRASKLACAHDFIMELPDGYSTLISEKGSTLSGGQRQRITIARTLLNYPRILILDEATSALDYGTERRLYLNLLNNEKRGSIFFVTHRLSLIKDANLIVVFHEGKIDELGTHQELIEKKGRYYALLKQSRES